MGHFTHKGEPLAAPATDTTQVHRGQSQVTVSLLERLFRPGRQPRVTWANEYLFKQNLIEIVVRVTVIITPLIGLGYLAAYFLVEPLWSTMVLALGLFGLSPVGLISLSLARRGGLKIAAQIYMFYLWVVSGLLTLFLSDRLILIGILVLSLNALLALFIEDLNVAVRWIGATAVLYAGMITLRFSGVFPPVVLGFVEPIFLFVAPLALFITLALLGNATTYYLRSTLSKSEDLRRELEESYEEARRATVFAQEANRLKSEFLSTMSHELRTPLNAIIGFSEIMVSGMSGSLDSEASKMLDRVLINARHLLGLINDILDLSKIEARQHELTIEAFSPLDLLKDTHSQMSSLAQRKGIEFKLDVSNPLPPVLYSDPEVLKQIVINLLSNAIKFTDKGTVRLITNTGDSVLNISVEDTGIGIPPHALDFIFDPFRQVDGTTTRAHSGTGLGLAIAKSYVNQLGGSIHVKSVPGEGSTFIVLLPVAASAEQARGFIR